MKAQKPVHSWRGESPFLNTNSVTRDYALNATATSSRASGRSRRT